MAAVRISPGIYQVNGKTVRATTAAEAEKMAGGGGKAEGPKATPGGGKAPKAVQVPKTIETVREGVEANRGVSTTDAEANIRINNPNVTGPLGSSTTKVNPDGTVDITQELSPDQKAILEGGQGLTKLGQGLATETLAGVGSGPQYRDGINYDPVTAEKAVYDSMTRGVAEKNQSALQNLQQQLFNKGLQPGTAEYDRQYKMLAESQGNFDLNARNQATITGLSAQNQFFNQNETQRANDMATYNNKIGAAGALSNLGTGLLMPNFPNFQGANISSGTPTDINAQLGALKQGNRQLNIAQQAANSAGGGGGGGGGGSGPTPAQLEEQSRREAGFA